MINYMINKQDFARLREEIEKFEEKREGVIITSREIIKLSKLLIYSLHRNDLNEARGYEREIRKLVKSFPKESYDTGMRNIAAQEFVEALAFYEFMKSGKLILSSSLKKYGITPEDYLNGICDLSGELARYAVNAITRKNYKEVVKVRELVDGIYGEFLKLNLRNSELRKKADSIKWNLKKLEELGYDVEKFS